MSWPQTSVLQVHEASSCGKKCTQRPCCKKKTSYLTRIAKTFIYSHQTVKKNSLDHVVCQLGHSGVTTAPVTGRKKIWSLPCSFTITCVSSHFSHPGFIGPQPFRQAFFNQHAAEHFKQHTLIPPHCTILMGSGGGGPLMPDYNISEKWLVLLRNTFFSIVWCETFHSAIGHCVCKKLFELLRFCFSESTHKWCLKGHAWKWCTFVLFKELWGHRTSHVGVCTSSKRALAPTSTSLIYVYAILLCTDTTQTLSLIFLPFT